MNNVVTIKNTADLDRAAENLCIMEWPENIEDLLPEETLRIHIAVNHDGSQTLSW